MRSAFYIAVRIAADRFVDPWDVSMDRLRAYVSTETVPTSRFWFGSPCRFVRSIDLAVHVWLPAAIEERFPELAVYLRTTSPRWGAQWRDW